MDIKDLLDKPVRPRVFLDISIGNKPIGRAIFELVCTSRRVFMYSVHNTNNPSSFPSGQ
jgi:hypothetical protein